MAAREATGAKPMTQKSRILRLHEQGWSANDIASAENLVPKYVAEVIRGLSATAYLVGATQIPDEVNKVIQAAKALSDEQEVMADGFIKQAKAEIKQRCPVVRSEPPSNREPHRNRIIMRDKRGGSFSL